MYILYIILKPYRTGLALGQRICRYGVSIYTPMVRSLRALGLFDRSKPSEPDSPAVTSQISAFNGKMAATPTCVWLNTVDNARKTQMLCGLVFVRLQIAATDLALCMHLMDGPDEVHLRTMARHALRQSAAQAASLAAYFTTPEQLRAPPQIR